MGNFRVASISLYSACILTLENNVIWKLTAESKHFIRLSGL